MLVEAQQIIPVKVEMSEKEAIIAILKNKNWWNRNIDLKDNKLVDIKEGREDRLVSDNPLDIELFICLARILEILDENE